MMNPLLTVQITEVCYVFVCSEATTNTLLLGVVAGAVGTVLLISIGVIIGCICRSRHPRDDLTGSNISRENRSDDNNPNDQEFTNIPRPRPLWQISQSLTSAKSWSANSYQQQAEGRPSIHRLPPEQDAFPMPDTMPSFVSHSLLSNNRQRHASESSDSSIQRAGQTPWEFRLPRPQQRTNQGPASNYGYRSDEDIEQMEMLDGGYRVGPSAHTPDARDALSWPQDAAFFNPTTHVSQPAMADRYRRRRRSRDSGSPSRRSSSEFDLRPRRPSLDLGSTYSEFEETVMYDADRSNRLRRSYRRNGLMHRQNSRESNIARRRGERDLDTISSVSVGEVADEHFVPEEQVDEALTYFGEPEVSHASNHAISLVPLSLYIYQTMSEFLLSFFLFWKR